MSSRIWNRILGFFGFSLSSPKTKEQLQIEVRDLMEQMARTNELDECCRFLSVLLLAYTFENKRPTYFMSSKGRGDVSVIVSNLWLRTEDCRQVLRSNKDWEEHCFGEKGSDDAWLL